jgi:hypothetical protein
VQVRTDDEVYRVDAVWLGPPKATFPWRARYVAWGVGIVVFILALTVERWAGFGFGFFTVAWALVATVVLTRLICARISHERPLGAVFTMWVRELTTPREASASRGGAVSATRIRVRGQRPRPQVRTMTKQRNANRGGMKTVARPMQHVPHVHHAPVWSNQSTMIERHAGRPRSKEVGGVRTQGRS